MMHNQWDIGNRLDVVPFGHELGYGAFPALYNFESELVTSNAIYFFNFLPRPFCFVNSFSSVFTRRSSFLMSSDGGSSFPV